MTGGKNEMITVEDFVEGIKSLKDSNQFSQGKALTITALSIFPNEFSLLVEYYRICLHEQKYEQAAALLKQMFMDRENKSNAAKLMTVLQTFVDQLSTVIEDAFNQQLLLNYLPSDLVIQLFEWYADNLISQGPAYYNKTCEIYIKLATAHPDNLKLWLRTALVCCISNLETKNAIYSRYFVDFCLPRVMTASIIENWNIDSSFFQNDLASLCKYQQQVDANHITYFILLALKQYIWNAEWGNIINLLQLIANAPRSQLEQLFSSNTKTNLDDFISSATNLTKEIFVKFLILLSKFFYAIHNYQNPSNNRNFIFLLNMNNRINNQDNMDIDSDLDSHLNELQVALQCWNILNNSYNQLFNFVSSHWNLEAWDLFSHSIADMMMAEMNTKEAENLYSKLLEKTTKAMKETNASNELLISKLRLQIGCCLLANGSKNAQKILYELLLSFAYSTAEMQFEDDEKIIGNNKFLLIPYAAKSIQFQSIKYLIQSCEAAKDWNKLLILWQFNWPYFRKDFNRLVEDSTGFSQKLQFPQLFSYIVNIDMLEEFAYLLNQGHCLKILPPGSFSQNTSVQRQIDLMSAMMENHISSLGPNMSIDSVLAKFYHEQLSSITNT